MKSDHFDIREHGRVHSHRDVPLELTGRSYREFRLWLGRQLEQLVARWAHAAAPSASRHRRPSTLRTRKPR